MTIHQYYQKKCLLWLSCTAYIYVILRLCCQFPWIVHIVLPLRCYVRVFITASVDNYTTISLTIITASYIFISSESKADSRCFTECRQVCLAGVTQAAIICPSCKCKYTYILCYYFQGSFKNSVLDAMYLFGWKTKIQETEQEVIRQRLSHVNVSWGTLIRSTVNYYDKYTVNRSVL